MERAGGAGRQPNRLADEGRLFNQGGFPMLVLSRKAGECVQIGRTIEVKVLEVSGSRVKLGFSAPPGVCIRRDELGGQKARPPAAWAQPSGVGELCTP
jgi:carbon storage regulator CsrA